MKTKNNSWTTPENIREQVRKIWYRGQILSAMAGSESLFPLRLPLKRPNSKELSDHFSDVRAWITQLSEGSGRYRLVWRQINHRVLGINVIPEEIWIDHSDDALALIGKQKVADQFADMLQQTRQVQPKLLMWLQKRPLRALELSDNWSSLLAVTGWLIQNPRPGIYLRQIDLPGVHTKLIEAHRGVLSELFDLVIPPEHIDKSFSGISGFCRRYGFLEKPARIRFRILDPTFHLLPAGFDQDCTVTENDFAELNLSAKTVFITENEINFLAFPHVTDAVLIFGSGYGFSQLSAASWLKHKNIYYWGDIDTHGFAILDQLRSLFPQTISMLMDIQTLTDHKLFWGTEDHPGAKNLTRLNDEESRLYNQLSRNQVGYRIRLEQERIGFDYLLKELRRRNFNPFLPNKT